RLGPGTALGRLMRFGHELRHVGVDRVEVREPAVSFACNVGEPPAEPCDGTTRLPAFDLFAGAIREVAHAFGVRPRAVGAAFEEGRPASGAGPLDRFTGGLVDGFDVVAVHVGRGQSVSRAAGGDIRVAGCVTEGNLGSELVVLANE